MAELQIVEGGGLLDQILGSTYEIWHEGMSRASYRNFYEGQRRTSWGSRHLRRFALVENGNVVASLKLYSLDAELDGHPIRIAGIGAVFTPSPHRRRGLASDLVTRVQLQAAAEGFECAMLFSEIGPAYYAALGFEPIATFDRTIAVIESSRYGAPMTMMRGGERRDLQAIAAMGRRRAADFRFHLDRDEDLIEYAIAKRRLLAGFGPAGARELQFFIAEEGTTAAAYIVTSVVGDAWTIEECGDRDSSGARVGALLQVLIAREPAERRPTISGWLPDGFVPPQVRIIEERPTQETLMVRPLADAAKPMLTLQRADVLWWKGDAF